jgi:predicted nucleic acid-binding Zn ribbon protein
MSYIDIGNPYLNAPQDECSECGTLIEEGYSVCSNACREAADR